MADNTKQQKKSKSLKVALGRPSDELRAAPHLPTKGEKDKRTIQLNFRVSQRESERIERSYETSGSENKSSFYVDALLRGIDPTTSAPIVLSNDDSLSAAIAKRLDEIEGLLSHSKSEAALASVLRQDVLPVREAIQAMHEHQVALGKALTVLAEDTKQLRQGLAECVKAMAEVAKVNRELVIRKNADRAEPPPPTSKH